MNKKAIALIAVSALFLAGCSNLSEEDKVVNATSELACLTKAAFEDLGNLDFERMLEMTPEELDAEQRKAEEEQAALEQQAEDIYKKYGFADETAFEEAAAKFEDNEEVRDRVQELTLQKCDFDIENMFGTFAEDFDDYSDEDLDLDLDFDEDLESFDELEAEIDAEFDALEAEIEAEFEALEAEFGL